MNRDYLWLILNLDRDITDQKQQDLIAKF